MVLAPWFAWFLEWYPGVVPGYLIRVPGYLSCLLLPEVVPGSLGLVGYLIRGTEKLGWGGWGGWSGWGGWGGGELIGVPGYLSLSLVTWSGPWYPLFDHWVHSWRP